MSVGELAPDHLGVPPDSFQGSEEGELPGNSDTGFLSDGELPSMSEGEVDLLGSTAAAANGAAGLGASYVPVAFPFGLVGPPREPSPSGSSTPAWPSSNSNSAREGGDERRGVRN